MYCKICGAALNPGDVFCRNCGASNTNLNNNQPNQGMQSNIPNVQSSINNQPELGQQNANLNDQFNSNNQININNQPNNQYQSMEFVEPVSPMNNYQQPTPPSGPIYQQPTPSVQPMPNVQPNMQTPPVNNNHPQPMKQNKNGNKSNGTILMIIGIIVGILAIVVVGYLIYTTLSSKKVDNGTTIVSKKSYNVYFAKHKFTFENDDVATPSEKSLKVSTSKYFANIGAVDDMEFDYLNEELANKVIKSASITADETKSSTYSGIKYFRTNVSTNSAKGAFLFTPKSNGGIWIIFVQNNVAATTYPTDSAINSVLDLIKSATVSTASSSQTDNEFDFSNLDFSSIINPDNQESAE